MRKNLKIIAIIPARGGSKSIPKKNIKDFCGKPLIAHTIELALKSKMIDRVIVSSDNHEIIEIALEYGLVNYVFENKSLMAFFYGSRSYR